MYYPSFSSRVSLSLEVYTQSRTVSEEVMLREIPLDAIVKEVTEQLISQSEAGLAGGAPGAAVSATVTVAVDAPANTSAGTQMAARDAPADEEATVQLDITAVYGPAPLAQGSTGTGAAVSPVLVQARVEVNPTGGNGAKASVTSSQPVAVASTSLAGADKATEVRQVSVEVLGSSAVPNRSAALSSSTEQPVLPTPALSMAESLSTQVSGAVAAQSLLGTATSANSGPQPEVVWLRPGESVREIDGRRYIVRTQSHTVADLNWRQRADWVFDPTQLDAQTEEQVDDGDNKVRYQQDGLRRLHELQSKPR